GSHLWVWPLQTRPESEAPQSASVVQPQKTPPEPSLWQAWPSGFEGQLPGFAPMSPDARAQGAQVSLPVLQTGVAPAHWVWFAPVHWTQAPRVASQAGVAGVPAQSASTVHGPQV